MSQNIEILTRLRDARANVLRNAESFGSAAGTLDHIGQILAKAVRGGIKYYETEILDLAAESGRYERAETKRLFKVVREARNMAVHEGAWARHLSTRLVDLFLILEEAITQNMTLVTDLMVRNPIIAESWHLAAHARKAMLENSFSCLPIFIGPSGSGKWKLLTDTALMKFLRGAETNATSKILLSTQLSKTFEDNQIVLAEAVCCSPQTTVESLVSKMTDLPVLIT